MPALRRPRARPGRGFALRRAAAILALALVVAAAVASAAAAGDPVVAAAGDIACDPSSSSFAGGSGTATECRQKWTSDLLLDPAVFPDLAGVLVLGDNQYENGTLSAYTGSYDPSWGRVKALTHPVPGNHEYGTPGATGYFQYFGAAAGDPAKGYYSFDLGAWHLVALNANCDQVGGCGPGSPEEQWLHADLAGSHAACVLAYWHQPRFSSGPHGSDATYDAFWRTLYAAGADVVLTGHDHLYERFAPQDPDARPDARGMREFVVGTGGRSLYTPTTARPNSELQIGGRFGVLKLTLHPAGYDWQFVGEGDEAVLDSGTTACSDPVAQPTIVRDDFERTVASGLGTADAGGPWSVSSSAATKVANGEAVISGWTGGNQDVRAWNPAVRNDMDVLALVRLNASNPVGASYQPRVVARAQADARNGYSARLVHAPSGAVSWGLSRVDNAGGTGSLALGSGTLLASGGAGTVWWIRLRVQGSTVQAKFWQDGTPEPSAWRLTASDAYWTAGRASFGVYTASGLASPFPSTGFRSFSAVDLGAGTPAAPPGAPSLTGAAPGDATVNLSWTPPSSDGGAAITGYTIYRGTVSGGETPLLRVGNVTAYTDTTAVNGTTYWYRVAAVNSAGEGAPSGELAATPQPAPTIVRDDFERTVASGLGTADAGGPWSVSSSAATKVANGEAVIYGWTGGNQDVRAWNPAVRNDMDVLALVRLNASNPVGASYQPRVVARAQADARNGYSARLVHAPSGAVSWGLSRVDNAGGTGSLALGSGTLLASGGAGTVWWIRLRVQGSTVQAKFWQDGAPEPSAWRLTASDAYWTAGRASFGVYTASGLASPFPSTGFRSFSAVDLGP